MADSQHPFDYTEPTVNALTTRLSPERMTTYLSATGGDKDWAFAMYLYNSRLAKSLLYPLNITEVTLRNAVDDVLVKEYGNRWHECPDLLNNTLNDRSRGALGIAISRVGPVSRSKVIAALTFDFWSNLFRPEYHELWRSNITIAFPHCPLGFSRDDVQPLVRDVNVVRNRVAHHEPLLRFDLNVYYSKMQKLASYRCPETVLWMKHNTTLSDAIRSRPKKNGVKVPVGERADTNFQTVAEGQTLLDIMTQGGGVCLTAYVCLRGNGDHQSFTATQVADYASKKAIDQGGLVDFSDYTVAQLLGDDTIKTSSAVVAADSPMLGAVQLLQKNARIKSLVVVQADGSPKGVIVRAHRRY
ncbi:hypothetical protein [Lentibacter algarum]|uniref:hypothetical protein n=1 Tax=Lentibacter algarum TaxID=576131 RepID=UPI0023027572|nr:hypothetical protein [Lentibacter algarum]